MDGPEYFSSDDEEYEENVIRAKKTYRQRVNFSTFYSWQFMERFRLRPSEAESVLRMIGNQLRHKTDFNCALSAQQQFLLALHWLALGTPLHGISDMHGVGKATVCRSIRTVVNLIVDQIASRVIRWPRDSSGIAVEFLRKGGFPSVWCCGWHPCSNYCSFAI